MGFVEKEVSDAFNSNTGAGLTANVIGNTIYSPHWNAFMVVNRGAVDIRILLDGGNVSGRRYDCPKNSIAVLEASENIKFSTMALTNLDGASALVSNTILFRVAYAVED